MSEIVIEQLLEFNLRVQRYGNGDVCITCYDTEMDITIEKHSLPALIAALKKMEEKG